MIIKHEIGYRIHSLSAAETPQEIWNKGVYVLVPDNDYNNNDDDDDDNNNNNNNYYYYYYYKHNHASN